MKRIFYIFTFLIFSQTLFAQVELEYLGLDNSALTDLDINYGIIGVGTDRNGVYWQLESTATETDWMHIALDSSVRAVYPHKSGPVGWAISAGIYPGTGEPPYVFCSFMGADFEANSEGMLPSQTFGIDDLDGYPDPTICGETYAAGGRSLYRRYFGDTTWQPVFNATIEGYIQTVKVRDFYPGVVLLGGADGFAGILLARSTDFGDTWEDISPFGNVLSIDFAGAAADTIFVAASDKIFRTSDGGATWQTVFEDGLAFRIDNILYDEYQNIVYAAGGTQLEGEALLMISYDFGETWEQIPLNDLGAIKGLEFGTDGWIYFITRDEGVYRFRDIVSNIDEVDGISDRKISLHQNYPNPFSSVTRIDYEITHPSDVILKVFNASGEEVKVFINEYQPAGRYSIIWDASDMPEGAYYIILKTMYHSATCKALIVRG
jgi:hypothetical protein